MKDTIDLAREAGFVENAGNIYGDHVNLKAFEALVRADEREACAKLCETKLGPTASDFYGKTYAAAIRARGNT
jgi:hypothetical protein